MSPPNAIGLWEKRVKGKIFYMEIVNQFDTTNRIYVQI